MRGSDAPRFRLFSRGRTRRARNVITRVRCRGNRRRTRPSRGRPAGRSSSRSRSFSRPRHRRKINYKLPRPTDVFDNAIKRRRPRASSITEKRNNNNIIVVVASKRKLTTSRRRTYRVAPRSRESPPRLQRRIGCDFPRTVYRHACTRR